MREAHVQAFTAAALPMQPMSSMPGSRLGLSKMNYRQDPPVLDSDSKIHPQTPFN